MENEQIAKDLFEFEEDYYENEGINSGVVEFFGRKYPQLKKIFIEKYKVKYFDREVIKKWKDVQAVMENY